MDTREFFHTLADECQLACLLEIAALPGRDLAQLQAAVPAGAAAVERAVARLLARGLIEGERTFRLADHLPGWVGAVIGELRRPPPPCAARPRPGSLA